jgi:hypothetical protein
MYDFQRLRFVTERYPHLQGLRLVPLGFVFLVSAAWRDGQLSWLADTAGHAAGFWFMGLLIVALAISSVLGRYYRRHFGTVQPERRAKGPLLFILFVALFAAAAWAQDSLRTHLSLPLVVIGMLLAHLGLAGGQRRSHYLALATGCLVFANLADFGVPAHARSVLLDDLIGIGLIVIGIGDHFLLRRTLQPVPHVETV